MELTDALAVYAGRRVLVTGHTGFKGSWLSLWLHELNASVTGLALPPDTHPSLFTAACVDGLIDSLTGDINDLSTVTDAVTHARPEVIFHLAAQPLVRRGYREPLTTFATNVMGTLHVLEAARRQPGVRAVVVVTTDKCYAPSNGPWGHRETDPLGGHDPYSASKACAELAVAAWRSSYEDAPLMASARAGNVIGGGDWAEDRIVPDLYRAARANQPAVIRHPGAVRPWQHVLEPLAGYLQLGAQLLNGNKQFASAWNFGPALEDMQPVSRLCDVLAPALGARWETPTTAVQHKENPSLRLDSSKAMLELGWQPRWRLEQTLAATANWYRRHDVGENARELVIEQIRAYVAHNMQETVA